MRTPRPKLSFLRKPRRLQKLERYRLPDGALPTRAFYQYVAQEAGVDSKVVSAVLKAAVTLSSIEMANGYSVKWPHVGSFSPTITSYMVRETGELKLRTQFRFKASVALRKAFYLWYRRSLTWSDLETWKERETGAGVRQNRWFQQALEAEVERRTAKRIKIV